MITRKIPSTGELLPVIGMGTWLKFDISPSDTPGRTNLRKILSGFASGGGRLLDTSPMYGQAEEVIGDLTDGDESFFYATKVWTTGREAGHRQIEDSFRKMKRSVMDLVQVHNLVDYQTQLKTMRAMKDENRIRYLGLTHYQSSQHDTLEKILRKEKTDFVQFNYSMNETHGEKSLLRTAEEMGVAVIINEPLDKGRLFARTRNKSLPVWANEIDISNWTSYFLKYIISDPAVTCVIPATSNMEHLREILSAGTGKLPDAHQRIKMREYFEAI